MKKLLLATALLASTTMMSNAYAAAEKYVFDKSHTNILMRINHLGFSDMTLEALKYDGHVMLDLDNIEKSSVVISIDSTGIDGDHDGFNAHMQSADLFHAEKFPTIEFKSTRIVKDKDDANEFDIHGELTLLGVTKPFKLEAKLNKAGDNPFSNKFTVGFSAEGELKRSDFGMTYALPLVGDEVEFDIELELNKAE